MKKTLKICLVACLLLILLPAAGAIVAGTVFLYRLDFGPMEPTAVVDTATRSPEIPAPREKVRVAAEWEPALGALVRWPLMVPESLVVEIAKDEDEYLKAYALFRYGLAEMNREEFETAIDSFTRVLNDYGRYVGCDIEAAYWLAVSLGQAREKEKAIVAAQRFLEDYPDAPERFRRSMEQMKNELVQEWESPLYDLSGRMSRVSKRIEGGDTGDKTQGEQKEIVSIIDELIRRAEQQEGQGQGQGGGGGGQPRGNRQPSSPLDRSTAPRGGGGETGDLRPKPTKKPGQQWGDMRDKEREEVLQALKQKFPDRYRELLEQYHKALAEGKRVTEPGEEAGDGN